MKSGICISGVLLLLLAVSPASAQDAKSEIRRLAKVYDVAVKAHDVKILNKLFDSDGKFVSADGRVFDKIRYIADLADKKVTYKAVKSEISSLRALNASINFSFGSSSASSIAKNMSRSRFDNLRK